MRCLASSTVRRSRPSDGRPSGFATSWNSRFQRRCRPPKRTPSNPLRGVGGNDMTVLVDATMYVDGLTSQSASPRAETASEHIYCRPARILSDEAANGTRVTAAHLTPSQPPSNSTPAGVSDHRRARDRGCPADPRHPGRPWVGDQVPVAHRVVASVAVRQLRAGRRGPGRVLAKRRIARVRRGAGLLEGVGGHLGRARVVAEPRSGARPMMLMCAPVEHARAAL
jgi:hypothetical protein